MGYPNSTPFRPYLKIQATDYKGQIIEPQNTSLFDVPYNFIQNFEINFSSGIGVVTLQIFDPTFTVVLDQLVSMVNANSQSAQFNFLILFGWGPESSSEGTLLQGRNTTYEHYFQNYIKETGEINFSRYVQQGTIQFDRYNLCSPKYLVFFNEVIYRLNEAGAIYEFKGFNTGVDALRYYTQVEKAYSGTPIELIQKISRDIWKDTEVEIRFKNTLDVKDGAKKSHYNPGNRTVSDVYTELLTDVLYKDNKIEWRWYIETNTELPISKTIINFIPYSIDVNEKEFLGRYSYYTGRDSIIIKGIKLDSDNLLKYFRNVKVGFADAKTKAQMTDASNPDNQNPISTDPGNKAVTTSTRKDNLKEKGLVQGATVEASQFPKQAEPDQKKRAQILGALQRNFISWPIVLDIVTLGDPTLTFRHLYNSFMQLDVYQKNGERNIIFSGVYLLMTFTHSISINGEFITHLKLFKQTKAMEHEEFTQPRIDTVPQNIKKA